MPAHLAAVSLIYGAALAIVGGFDSSPFPPDLPIVAARHGSLTTAPICLKQHPGPRVFRDVVTASSDIALPWTFDGEGRAQFTTR